MNGLLHICTCHPGIVAIVGCTNADHCILHKSLVLAVPENFTSETNFVTPIALWFCKARLLHCSMVL